VVFFELIGLLIGLVISHQVANGQMGAACLRCYRSLDFEPFRHGFQGRIDRFFYRDRMITTDAD